MKNIRKMNFHRELSKDKVENSVKFLNEIPHEYIKLIMNLYLEDKIDMLLEAVANDEVKDGTIFTVSDLFTKEEWKFLKYFPGNKELGMRFKYLIDNNNLPIEQVTSEWGSKYSIRKLKKS